MANVIIIGKYYFPFSGGIEENTRDVAEAIAKNYSVSVICNNHTEGEKVDHLGNVVIHRTRTLATIKSQPIGLTTFAKVLLAKADVIHFHAPNPWLSLALLINLAVSRPPAKLVITHHMDMWGRPILRAVARVLYNKLLARASLLIATSHKNVACSSDIWVACRTEAIPLGVNPEEFALTREEREEARAWIHEMSGGRPVVGFVGRHARYKGLDVLMQVIARNDDLFGVLAGDGPYRGQAEQLARELGIEDRVRFLGRVDEREKLRVLAGIDVFTFPSTEITEAFGISQLEAMAAGTPVVASDLPTGVSDVSVNEVTALTVKPNDADALSGAVRRILSDDALREQIIANAADAVMTKFNNAVLPRKTADAILSVLD